TVLGLAGGVSSCAFPADARIKALMLLEPGPTAVGATMDDIAQIAVPYLLMRGAHPLETRLPSFLATTLAASPRIEVVSPNVVHTSDAPGACHVVDDARTQAVEARGGSIVPEVLSNLDLTNAAAAFAYGQWNLADPPNPNSSGFGGSRNFCTHVGIHL